MKTFILALALFMQSATMAETPAPMAASKAALVNGAQQINAAAEQSAASIDKAGVALVSAWDTWKIQITNKMEKSVEAADKEIAAVITAASEYKTAELKTGTAAIETVAKVATEILQPKP